MPAFIAVGEGAIGEADIGPFVPTNNATIVFYQQYALNTAKSDTFNVNQRYTLNVAIRQLSNYYQQWHLIIMDNYNIDTIQSWSIPFIDQQFIDTDQRWELLTPSSNPTALNQFWQLHAAPFMADPDGHYPYKTGGKTSTIATLYNVVLDDGVTQSALPTSSLNVRFTLLGLQVYISCVVAYNQLDNITAFAGGDLIVYRSVNSADGGEHVIEFARAPIEGIRQDEGAANKSITLTARGVYVATTPKDSIVKGLFYRYIDNTSIYRAEIPANLDLKVGDTAIIDYSGESFIVGDINYRLGGNQNVLEMRA